MKEKKRVLESSPPPARGSGIFRNLTGGQDIYARPMTIEERVELVLDLADGSDPGLEPYEKLLISLVQANPEFGPGSRENRNEIALGVLGLFETLNDEEAETVMELNRNFEDASLDGGRWDNVRMSLVPPEYREGVQHIFETSRDQPDTFGAQLPILLCEHAKAIVREKGYLESRRAIEAAAWDLDDDIAGCCREALDIIEGKRGYSENAVVDSLARNRIAELGMGNAIGEVARLWQGLRNAGAGERLARDAIFAFGHTNDGGVEPTAGALDILSEIGKAGLAMIDPKLTIISAAIRILREEPS